MYIVQWDLSLICVLFFQTDIIITVISWITHIYQCLSYKMKELHHHFYEQPSFQYFLNIYLYSRSGDLFQPALVNGLPGVSKISRYSIKTWVQTFFYYYLSTVDLQLCVSSRWPAKWFMYVYVYVFVCVYLFRFFFHYSLL